MPFYKTVSSLACTVYLVASDITKPKDKNVMNTAINTANEGPVRIQYKCLVPIIPSNETEHPPYFQNRIICNVLSPSSYTYISVKD